ncbi:unnamed protein product [Larinioides sclopetarius]|uniref:Uncharacterized protein n=1 Tax=Larinioides sclopetarius TaxID=280406 RepID=A0AAV1ZB62_9ARAC
MAGEETDSLTHSPQIEPQFLCNMYSAAAFVFQAAKEKQEARVHKDRPFSCENLRKGPFLPQALRRMIARSEKTGHLGVQPGRGRKSTISDVVEGVATTIVEKSMDNDIGCSRTING